MRDDGVSIEVLKRIKKELEGNQIEVFVLETDINFLFSILKEDDLAIFVDAMISSGNVGEVKIFRPDLSEENECFCHAYFPWNAISKICKEIFIIGIEIEDIDFRIGLSENLQDKIEYIANDVLHTIEYILTKGKNEV